MRSRKRFLALYLIADKQTSACAWAREIGRAKETILKWVHHYNRFGPEAVFYRHTNGRRPSFCPEQVKQLLRVICETEPVEHGLPSHCRQEFRTGLLHAYVAPSL